VALLKKILAVLALIGLLTTAYLVHLTVFNDEDFTKITPTDPLGQPTELPLIFNVTGSEVAPEVLQDVKNALQAQAGPICIDLQIDCRFTIMLEVFPDQQSFDRMVMNPEMGGFFAISGQNRIQMVSPDNPAPHEISYEDGISIAVHEFVHLALDKIDPDLPAWLDEGTAVYLGPHAIYDYVCRGYFPFDQIPRLRELRENYSQVPAADLFAYSLVSYIAGEYGLDTLNALLRAPYSSEEILGVADQTLDVAWRQYIETTCTNEESPTK